MGIFDWFNSTDDNSDNNIIVKSTRSKGDGRPMIDITVGDIRKGIATDENGYRNEVVLFLRKNKRDR
ncbi:MAG TPA: hypothetical protein DCM40_46570 [Maribacter sp.]|jgi:hypothetical protein|nr:hypothetical protein [Maribacter sp.]|tara:strand:+ start:404 stop:604 length:201 start_codon:yes stop_codon:yes gene_type:complete